ncbi:hypothetical protein [Psychrobacillus sp. FSL K6-1464]|uniref:hypothetical protein n=1 Tax=Psychrobacillus sp. FSL K6-1464 TaxID=2921545 RepID=UPI0030F500E3
MVEQQVLFKRDREKPKELESELVFNLMDRDGETFEVALPFSCGEDLQNYMKAFILKKWDELFEERIIKKGISDGEIEGIRVSGKNDKGRFAIYLENGYQNASFIVNNEVLSDENAEKLSQIKAILR